MKKSVFLLFLILSVSLYSQNEELKSESKHKLWQEDYRQLIKLIETKHLNYGHTVSEEIWKAKVHQIYDSIPKMSDIEVIGAMMSTMALIGDGHTLLYPPLEGKYAFKALPIELYFFEEDLYIRSAAPEYRALAGAKVLGVGNMDTKQLISGCRKFISRDNAMQLKWIIPIALSFADTYMLVGAAEQRNHITFKLLTSSGQIKTQTIKSGPLSRDPMGRFGPDHWEGMNKGQNNLWTKDPDNYYWYTYLEDKKTVYFQFNQIRNKPSQSLDVFCQELFHFITSNEVSNLIIDLRLNNGGNNLLNKFLIDRLVTSEKINKKGHLFTIIGRRTFSAAMNLASSLELKTQTIFVGEPTGSKPNFYGEDNHFVLPNSKLTGSISNKYWQGGRSSEDKRPWIAPDLPAPLTAEHYINNHDPALSEIFKYINIAR